MRLESSYITIHDVRLHARHGVMEQERAVGADYEVTLRVGYDVSRAMTTDDIADTISYARLYELIRAEMNQPSALLEHVAGRIARSVMKHFPQVSSVSISVRKLNPPMGADCRGASVELHLINDKTQT